jgi:hypothetical protein
MTLIVWIIAVLSIAQIVIYTAFYDPFAGSADDEDDSDSNIECDDEAEDESNFLNIYGEATGDCVIYGENAEASVTVYAGAAFWFAAVQMILVIISAIMSTVYLRKLGSQGFSDVKVFQTY